MKRHNEMFWGLTDRQCECLKAVAMHRSSKAAARVMGIAPKTVDVYLQSAMHRMGVSKRREAVALWVKNYPQDAAPLLLAAQAHAQANAVLLFNLGRAIGRPA
jgi:DNA-binding CsgD family transcriptional regulator